MKLRLLDLLVCPIDKTPLELLEWESWRSELSEDDVERIRAMGLNPSSFSTEITTGVLINRSRRVFYPIHCGVPRMLVFPTSLTREFVRVHADRLGRELPGFVLPNEALRLAKRTYYVPSLENGSAISGIRGPTGT